MGRGGAADSSFSYLSDERLIVYVPAEPLDLSLKSLAVGSAIVGTPQADGQVLIDFEGDIYHSTPRPYAERLMHAAGRHAWGERDGQLVRYPTVARRVVPVEALVEIGEWNGSTGELELNSPEAEGLLSGWLGRPTLSDDDLLAHSYRYDNQCILRQMRASGDPAERIKADFFARQLHLD